MHRLHIRTTGRYRGSLGTSRGQRPGLCRGSLAAVLCLLLSAAFAQQGTTITPNYREADIRQIVEAVSAVTDRNFILDPRVNAKVTMLSSSPMTPEEFYEAFLSVLEVHGYVAVEAGDVVKIIPDAAVRQYPTAVGGEVDSGEDIVTRVIEVEHVGAAQLVPVLRPLIQQYGHLASPPGSNMLIISDRAANVDRIIKIIRRIDVASDNDVEVVRLENASATEIVRVLTSLAQAPRADGMPTTLSLVADPRTNSILIGGEKSERLRLRALIAHLDTPLQDGGTTQVRYLHYADAEELAAKLQEHFAGIQATAQPGGPAAAGAGPVGTDEVSVWADLQTNALVINAPPKTMRSLMSIVDKLDIRRPQVLVEAIIVEITADKSAELGVTWAIDGSKDNNAVGVTNFPDAGPGIVQLGAAIGADGDPTNLIGAGATFGIGRISESGVSFAAILHALQGDADTNIISTPTIVTTDNEEASLNIGQEVPFLTGSFSSPGTGTGGVVNPFQTIQREQIGVQLTITPQISEGDTLILDISQELSSIASSSQGAVDIVTNQRTIDTTVIVEDGDILVLGGLIEDTLRENVQKVPILGSIPIIGALFRSSSTDKVKTNLMVFIHPRILRNDEAATYETESKYNYLRELQRQNRPRFGSDVPLLPGAERPILPPIEEYYGAPDDDVPPDSAPDDSGDGPPDP
ncbi:MAG TPA: type II secretion system secretin GspD [Woeseiaceae bacterium]|nr:type II secretion system secretin GspD [Woeseiaceae bacterium]